LVQQGLVERRADPNDRCVKQITLSDKGHQLLYENFRNSLFVIRYSHKEHFTLC